MIFGSWVHNSDDLVLDYFQNMSNVVLNDYVPSGTWDLVGQYLIKTSFLILIFMQLREKVSKNLRTWNLGVGRSSRSSGPIFSNSPYKNSRFFSS